MIQRIQSIFLFFIGACMIAMLFLPIWTKTGAEGEIARLSAISLTYKTQAASGSITTSYIGVLCVIAMILAYSSLFSFKNRMLQIKLNLANSLVMVSVMGCCAYLISYHGEQMLGIGTKGSVGVGLFMPAISLVLNMLANRFIWKDEKLVKSSNRLRD
jgi:hypothetical protein